MSAMNVDLAVTADASVSAASLPEFKKTPYISSRIVTRSPGVNPMNVESAGSWLIEAGTVTVVFSPIRSTATMAVKIFVRLAGAHAARAFDCHRNRPVSRLKMTTSCASMAGTGIGRAVARDRGVTVTGAGDGVGIGLGLAV